jgi:hypothetical protein
MEFRKKPELEVEPDGPTLIANATSGFIYAEHINNLSWHLGNTIATGAAAMFREGAQKLMLGHLHTQGYTIEHLAQMTDDELRLLVEEAAQEPLAQIDAYVGQLSPWARGYLAEELYYTERDLGITRND